ncbi:MAG: YfcE family phosphodiesterase [bacterium]|nr:YfcE family phosphodiesterase [bacterium]
MKIGVISDTHDNLEYIKKAIRYFNEEKVDKVFHAGDISQVDTAEAFNKLNMPLILAFGNTDKAESELITKLGAKLELSGQIVVTELCGIRIVLVHNILLIPLEIRRQADLIIHGHTHHVEDIVINSTRILNPGECSAKKFGVSTVMIYDFETENVTLKQF